MFGRAYHNFAGERRYALYSQDGRRRLLLEIDLVPPAPGCVVTGPSIVWVMCNPSTATEEKNDPTVAKITKFSRRWGFAMLVVVNVFDWRDTDPKAMKRAAEPNGPANDAAILGAVARADLVMLACGRNGEHQGRVGDVHAMLRFVAGVRPSHLRDPRKWISDEQPVHPLYQYDGCVPSPLHLPTDLCSNIGRCNCPEPVLPARPGLPSALPK